MLSIETINSGSIVGKNGVRVVNTTPHPLTFQDVDGEIITCPSNPELLINAKSCDIEIGDLFIQTNFVANEDGLDKIAKIKEAYPDAVIIGSMIACNAYKEVVGLVPVPGFERVAPAEKRMRLDRFNVGGCW